MVAKLHLITSGKMRLPEITRFTDNNGNVVGYKYKTFIVRLCEEILEVTERNKKYQLEIGEELNRPIESISKLINFIRDDTEETDDIIINGIKQHYRELLSTIKGDYIEYQLKEYENFGD